MIKVLVVDDSAVVRHLISSVLEDEPEIQVVGTARDGQDAIEKVDRLAPDVVTLDIEMPRLDGLETLRVLRPRHPKLPVIMFSTLTERGASATLEALSLGASDFVTKPVTSSSVSESKAAVRDQLVPRIHALAGMRRVAGSSPPRRPRRDRPAPSHPPEILVVASSTGGPDALVRVLSGLPGDFALPVVVVQHMPPVFTTMFAQRLDRVSALDVREARDGDVARRGRVLLAPGDHHLRLTTRGLDLVATLDQGEPEHYCRPAADPLLRSAVATCRGRVLAVVLTGMGVDGLAGCRDVVDGGGAVLAQDEATSVVWGMPGAVARAGLADEVLPLDRIAQRINARATQALTST
ncbi:MAG TPA: chemotaxis response regulator protein-glutamate methylesterase [Nocardioides sp.]|nr:chemotaxis response regulator protein-glutamate methylesterase [Nocardioides sp.]